MTIFLKLQVSDKPEKKYYVDLQGSSGRTKRIYFGDSNAKDFTLFNALEREEHKRRYINRHQAREDWNLTGAETAGFWSRWILWSRPTVKESLNELLRKYPSLVKTRHDAS
jgi:hypothetical protein